MELETSVSALKEAESKAAAMASEAQANKEERMKRAREEAAALVDKGHKDAAKLKDSLLAKGREEIEKETSAISEKAKKNADAVRKTKVPAEASAKIAKSLFKDVLG
ncbi:MAG: hypothetical protein Q7T16_01215 [Candidatus Burarchaeum sp.]|nr:hypothetical protein [Candidatus Burarchaeum sp.]MDO8339256.1 hypothetical protein [Candidatus Burarchaeum sp.]